MQDSLEAMFPVGTNLGSRYESINENIYQNDFFRRIALKYKNLGSKIDFIPLPNDIRHAKRDQVDSYFNDHI